MAVLTDEQIAGAPSYVDKLVKEYAQKYGIDPLPLLAMRGMESGGTPNPFAAVSSAGAAGPMQVMPATAAEIQQKTGITDPIEQGVWYYKQQYDRFGDPAKAAAAYHSGPKTVQDIIARGGDLATELGPAGRNYYSRVRSAVQTAPPPSVAQPQPQPRPLPAPPAARPDLPAPPRSGISGALQDFGEGVEKISQFDVMPGEAEFKPIEKFGEVMGWAKGQAEEHVLRPIFGYGEEETLGTTAGKKVGEALQAAGAPAPVTGIAAGASSFFADMYTDPLYWGLTAAGTLLGAAAGGVGAVPGGALGMAAATFLRGAPSLARGLTTGLKVAGVGFKTQMGLHAASAVPKGIGQIMENPNEVGGWRNLAEGGLSGWYTSHEFLKKPASQTGRVKVSELLGPNAELTPMDPARARRILEAPSFREVMDIIDGEVRDRWLALADRGFVPRMALPEFHLVFNEGDFSRPRAVSEVGGRLGVDIGHLFADVMSMPAEQRASGLARLINEVTAHEIAHLVERTGSPVSPHSLPAELRKALGELRRQADFSNEKPLSFEEYTRARDELLQKAGVSSEMLTGDPYSIAREIVDSVNPHVPMGRLLARIAKLDPVSFAEKFKNDPKGTLKSHDFSTVDKLINQLGVDLQKLQARTMGSLTPDLTGVQRGPEEIIARMGGVNLRDLAPPPGLQGAERGPIAGVKGMAAEGEGVSPKEAARRERQAGRRGFAVGKGDKLRSAAEQPQFAAGIKAGRVVPKTGIPTFEAPTTGVPPEAHFGEQKPVKTHEVPGAREAIEAAREVKPTTQLDKMSGTTSKGEYGKKTKSAMELIEEARKRGMKAEGEEKLSADELVELAKRYAKERPVTPARKQKEVDKAHEEQLKGMKAEGEERKRLRELGLWEGGGPDEAPVARRRVESVVGGKRGIAIGDPEGNMQLVHFEGEAAPRKVRQENIKPERMYAEGEDTRAADLKRVLEAAKGIKPAPKKTTFETEAQRLRHVKKAAKAAGRAAKRAARERTQQEKLREKDEAEQLRLAENVRKGKLSFDVLMAQPDMSMPEALRRVDMTPVSEKELVERAKTLGLGEKPVSPEVKARLQRKAALAGVRAKKRMAREEREGAEVEGAAVEMLQRKAQEEAKAKAEADRAAAIAHATQGLKPPPAAVERAKTKTAAEVIAEYRAKQGMKAEGEEKPKTREELIKALREAQLAEVGRVQTEEEEVQKRRLAQEAYLKKAKEDREKFLKEAGEIKPPKPVRRTDEEIKASIREATQKSAEVRRLQAEEREAARAAAAEAAQKKAEADKETSRAEGRVTAATAGSRYSSEEARRAGVVSQKVQAKKRKHQAKLAAQAERANAKEIAKLEREAAELREKLGKTVAKTVTMPTRVKRAMREAGREQTKTLSAADLLGADYLAELAKKRGLLAEGEETKKGKRKKFVPIKEVREFYAKKYGEKEEKPLTPEQTDMLARLDKLAEENQISDAQYNYLRKEIEEGRAGVTVKRELPPPPSLKSRPLSAKELKETQGRAETVANSPEIRELLKKLQAPQSESLLGAGTLRATRFATLAGRTTPEIRAVTGRNLKLSFEENLRRKAEAAKRPGQDREISKEDAMKLVLRTMVDKATYESSIKGVEMAPDTENPFMEVPVPKSSVEITPEIREQIRKELGENPTLGQTYDVAAKFAGQLPSRLRGRGGQAPRPKRTNILDQVVADWKKKKALEEGPPVAQETPKAAEPQPAAERAALEKRLAEVEELLKKNRMKAEGEETPAQKKLRELEEKLWEHENTNWGYTEAEANRNAEKYEELRKQVAEARVAAREEEESRWVSQESDKWKKLYEDMDAFDKKFEAKERARPELEGFAGPVTFVGKKRTMHAEGEPNWPFPKKKIGEKWVRDWAKEVEQDLLKTKGKVTGDLVGKYNLPLGVRKPGELREYIASQQRYIDSMAKHDQGLKAEGEQMRAEGAEFKEAPEWLREGALKTQRGILRKEIKDTPMQDAKWEDLKKFYHEGRLSAKASDAMEKLLSIGAQAPEIERLPGVRNWDRKWEILGAPRAFITSLDLSGILRQGAIGTAAMLARNPISVGKAIGESLKALASETVFQRGMKEIEGREDFHILRGMGVDFAKSEEQFTGARYAEQVLKKFHVPNFVRGSERAYSYYLNRLRYELGKHHLDNLRKLGFKDNPVVGMTKSGEPLIRFEGPDQEIFKKAAQWVNIATGRGGLPKGQDQLAKVVRSADGFLNAVLFSPRLMYGRLALFNPHTYTRTFGAAGGGTKGLRAAWALHGVDMVSYMALTAGMIGAFSALSDDSKVEWDMTSSDFAQVRLGNTRIDPTGGVRTYATALFRILSGQTKTEYGNIKEQSRRDTLFNFLRGKLSPTAGLAVNFMAGEDVVGNPMYATLTDVAKKNTPLDSEAIKQIVKETGGAIASNTAIPMIFADAYKLVQEHGWNPIQILPLMGAMTLGVGVSTREGIEGVSRELADNMRKNIVSPLQTPGNAQLGMSNLLGEAITAELSQREKKEIERLADKPYYEILSELAESPSFKQLPPEAQRIVLISVLAETKKARTAQALLQLPTERITKAAEEQMVPEEFGRLSPPPSYAKKKTRWTDLGDLSKAVFGIGEEES